MKLIRLLKDLKKSLKQSFTSKIYLTLICAIAVISCSITAFFLHHLKESRTEILINKGELLAEQLAENARIGVFAENDELLAEPLRTVIIQKEALAAEIFTIHGQLLGSRHRKNPSPSARNKSTNMAPREEQTVIRQLAGSATPIYRLRGGTIDFWAPVQQATRFTPSETLLFTDNPRQAAVQTIGFVRIVMDKGPLEKSFKTLLYKSIMITSVILALVLVGTYFFTKGITRPLSRLHDNVLALGTGASVEQIPVENNDEVGRLAMAFNDMAESLKMREREKEQLTEQLLHAQKMEAVGTLAGGIAHDFNNILTAIIGYSHLLWMKTAEGDPLRNYIGQIQSSSDRAVELINGLLAFSRKQVMMPKAVEVNEIVGDLQKMLRRLIGADTELDLEAAREDLVIMADRGKIEQVLMNLVTNARDAMSKGGRIVISTSMQTMNAEFLHAHGNGKPGQYACIAVSDTGDGMDEETRNKIFEPFYTRKEVGKGTGLGLSIVYGIVKQHNGYISVYSEPGTGTIFKIYLPLIEAKKDLPVVKEQAYPCGGNETLLLAEDDPSVSSFHKNLLEEFGYRVITAADGQEALDMFAENQGTIELLILDVAMPKMNGKEVFDRIRKKKTEMKVVFISGYSAEVLSGTEFMEKNMCFMTKPVDPVEFLKNVRETLDRQYGKHANGGCHA